jgi:hypothetical protein
MEQISKVFFRVEKIHIGNIFWDVIYTKTKKFVAKFDFLVLLTMLRRTLCLGKSWSMNRRMSQALIPTLWSYISPAIMTCINFQYSSNISMSPYASIKANYSLFRWSRSTLQNLYIIHSEIFTDIFNNCLPKINIAWVFFNSLNLMKL